MRKTRLLNPKAPKRGELTLSQWVTLATKALAAAREVSDTRRARLIQEALRQGNPSQVLKRLGIICENDIRREFAPKT